jgi:nitrous oxidase accessory protein NosD
VRRIRAENVWHVRIRTPVLRDMPDDAASCELVNQANAIGAMSAYVFDPADGTVSVRSGAQVIDPEGWPAQLLPIAAALGVSLAWGLGPTSEEGHRDGLPHPERGERTEPDSVLTTVPELPRRLSPVSAGFLRTAHQELGRRGHPTDVNVDEGWIGAFIPIDMDRPARWVLGTSEHPYMGPGVAVRLILPHAVGPLQGRWLANALNLAEVGDWRGEQRPPALGAWTWHDGWLAHVLFLPGLVFEDDATADLVDAADTLLDWGHERAVFAMERLPWLLPAAASRHPLDEPAAERRGDAFGEDDEDAEDDGEHDDELRIPWELRSFGPAVRAARPRDPEAPVVVGPGRELLVDPADPVAFAEIDGAAAEADDGDVIRVRPGVYRTPVLVDRAFAIVGVGDPDAIVLEPVGGEALGFAASGGSVEGITIRPSRVGSDGQSWSAVAVHNVSARVEGCRLSSHLGATVWVGGPNARVEVQGCDIRDGAQNAVWVTEEAHVVVAACRVSGNRWPIVASGNHAVLEVHECEVVDNLDIGIVAQDHALLTVSDSTVSGNAGSGVELGVAAPASVVEGCTIERNLLAGVLVGAGVGTAIRRNTIRGNQVGIIAVGGATPLIEDNELHANHTGIGVRGRGSAPEVTGNRISATVHAGVIVDEEAGGVFEGNTLSGSGGPGIWVDDPGTSPHFATNHVSESAEVAIRVTDGGGGRFSSNDLRGNTGGSWHVDEPGELVRTGNLEDASVGQLWPPDRPATGPARLN